MLRRIALALSLALLFCLSSIPASAAGCTGTGNCYFFGGSDNWSNTAKWCTTDTNPCGGATGGLPSATDNCNFTANSNTTAYTVTVDVTGTCLDITTALPSVSGAPTIATSSFPINVSGSMNYVAGTLATGGSGYGFNATATGKTITTNGVSFAGSFLFNGVGGGWTLNDALTTGATRTLNVTNGTLNTNAQTVTVGNFVSTSGTRTLTFTNSTFNITGASGTPWNVATTGSLTSTFTGSTINFNGGAAGTLLTINGSSVTYAAINITGAGTWQFNGGSSIADFSYTSTTNKTDTLQITSGLLITSTLTLAGNSSVNRAFIKSTTLGSPTTITHNGATTTLTNVDFQDTTTAGTYGTWTGTSLGDALGNSGITFDASTTQTFTGNGGTSNWSDVTRWTSRVPLPQDDAIQSTTVAGTIVVADMPRMGRNLDFSSSSRLTNFNASPVTVFGNIYIKNFTGTQAMTLAGRGSHTITSAGQSFSQAVTLAAFGGTYTQQDAFATASALSIVNGTWVDGGFASQAQTLNYSSANVRGFNFTGTTTLTFTSGGTVVNGATTTNLTVISAPSIILSGGSASTLVFAGGGLTFRDLWWSNLVATGGLTLTGANTFRDFKIDGTTARTVTFPASTVTTVNTFTKSNTTRGVRTTLQSSTPDTRATLLSRGPEQSLERLTVTDINALGGAGWFAGNYSVNGGNNYGWKFYPPGDIMTIMKQRRSSNDNFKSVSMAA